MGHDPHLYNSAYSGDRLDHVAFPLGSIGAGMLCLDGTGSLSHVSLRHRPDLFHQPCVFSALYIKPSGGAGMARVLEGPVPSWKIFGLPGAGNGWPGTTYGLPRFGQASFRARFPFGIVELQDPDIPVHVTITGWSPFTPGDADSSSLPVAALEFRFRATGDLPLQAIYSFHAANFMATGSGNEAVLPAEQGFVLWQAGPDDQPWEEGAFCAVLDDAAAQVNHAWFRGGWFDPLSMVWRDVAAGTPEARPVLREGPPSPGGSLGLAFELEPGEERQIRLLLCWHVPRTNLRYRWRPTSTGCCQPEDGVHGAAYVPWYASRFRSIDEVSRVWRERVDSLRERSQRFADCFYDTTLPPEVVEAVAANLCILRAPTILRQADGRLWGWEGCHNDSGCCGGTCSHVWNYAQALPHLFPTLQRGIEHTQYHEGQDERGHQSFRLPLPIGPSAHDHYAAADGQLGSIMQIYREWRISGDMEWLRTIWLRVRASLDYCIRTWDPRHTGLLEEPHHNTYDIEFWGPEPMCSTIYLGALLAALTMGRALGEDVALYATLLSRGRQRSEEELFNGEYFQQQVRWTGLDAPDPQSFAPLHGPGHSPEAVELLQREGPTYQYGSGCLSDGVIGAWLAAACGLDEIIDRDKVASHLRSVYHYNFRRDLATHANPQRPGYALGSEGGLLLCTWPRGGRPALPFVYSDEVWTGIEYQVASHLVWLGMVDEGLEIVRTCRDRYDGRVRNPFDEYECGHFYVRAMASYALLQALSGSRCDAVDKTLTVHPRLAGDFRAFLCTATGYGTVGVRDGSPFLEVCEGTIDVQRIDYRPAGGRAR